MRKEDRYDSLFQFYGGVSGVDWRLLKAQATVESALNPDAKSPVGAAGLSQFMKRTWEEWRDGTPGIQPMSLSELLLIDPRDPEDGIRAQAAYMAWLLRQFVGKVDYALAAYNWGIGNVGRTPAYVPLMESVPRETQDYLVRVDTALRVLEERDGVRTPVG